MLEAGSIPELWSTIHGWFTPWVLFLVLNLVVVTIVITSMATAPAPAESGEEAAAEADVERNSLSGGPSTALDRNRSPNLPRFTAPAPEAPATGVLDLGQPDEQPPPLEMEPENPGEHEHAHMERSMSEAAVEPELSRLPARLRKSASDKLAFAHFVAEKDTEVVEERRPATTRDTHRRRPLVAKPEEEIEEAGGEVDARADEFINKFHQQLKLQRVDSYMRSRGTLQRRQRRARLASPAAAGAP